MRNSQILENELFSVVHISDDCDAERDILSFSTREDTGQGLVEYLQTNAIADESAWNMRTYIVRDRRASEMAGYFSLKAGLISLNEIETEDGVIFDTLPGVEVANFALNGNYLNAHSGMRGIGKNLFTDFIIPIIEDAASRIGIRIVYIFALPIKRLIDRYHEYGFVRLEQQAEDELHKRIKPFYDEGCIFMYQMLR